MTLVKWNDDRLDDLAREVHGLTDTRDAVIRLDGSVTTVHADVTALSAAFNEWKKDEAVKIERQREERKADRRWLIGTVLASASIIVGALAVFVG